MIDLRKAAEMALEWMNKEGERQFASGGWAKVNEMNDVMRELRQALAQHEQNKRVCNTCNGTGIVKDLHNWAGGGKRTESCWACHEVAQPDPRPEWMKGDPDINRALERASQILAQPEQEPVCRSDGRCQYAIDHGAEGLGHCPQGKCCMPQDEQALDLGSPFHKTRTTPLN